jgi:hypothetical protein
MGPGAVFRAAVLQPGAKVEQLAGAARLVREQFYARDAWLQSSSAAILPSLHLLLHLFPCTAIDPARPRTFALPIDPAHGRAMGDRTLLLTSEPAWSGAALAEVLQGQSLQLDAVELATSSAALLQSASVFDRSYTCVVSHAPSAGFHDVARLGSIARLMRKAAKLVVFEPAQVGHVSAFSQLPGTPQAWSSSSL